MSPVNDFVKREPFQFTARKRWQDGQLQTYVVYLVPSDKRLVIENVSAKIEVLLDQELHGVDVKTIVGSVEAWHSILAPKIGTKDNLNIYCGGQQTRIYADPGTAVNILVHRDVSAGAIGITLVSISGYLLSAESLSLAP